MNGQDRIAATRDEVARLSRILANEGVMDAFGHVSLRHPERPDRFFLPRARAPELVQPEDVVEFDMDAQPAEPVAAALFSERALHAAIYRARPDVGAVAHHHSPSVLPFCLTGTRLQPVTQLGAVIGFDVPLWDSRTRFGATNHLVVTREEADDLAAALGDRIMVLMRRHGATVVAGNVQELAFRTIYGCRNAETQYRAALLGAVDTLTEDEVALAAAYPPSALQRAWELWSARIG